jgi:hypothetical protein
LRKNFTKQIFERILQKSQYISTRSSFLLNIRDLKLQRGKYATMLFGTRFQWMRSKDEKSKTTIYESHIIRTYISTFLYYSWAILPPIMTISNSSIENNKKYTKIRIKK